MNVCFVGARLNSLILANTLKIQGFMCYDHFSRWPQAHAVLNEWIDKVVGTQLGISLFCFYFHLFFFVVIIFYYMLAFCSLLCLPIYYSSNFATSKIEASLNTIFIIYSWICISMLICYVPTSYIIGIKDSVFDESHIKY